MAFRRVAGHFLAAALALAAAPSLTLKDLSGKAVSLEDYRGKVVLLDFWATWCDSCLESLPVYQQLYQSRRDAGLVVLGIDEDARAKGVAAFAAAHGVGYPVLADPGKKAFYAYRVRGLPTAFLIDGEGRIARRWVGFQKEDAASLRSSVDALLPAPTKKK